MESKEQYLAIDSPTLLNLAIFNLEDQADSERTLEVIKKSRWPEPPVVSEKSARIRLEEVLCSVKLTREKNCDVFSIEASHISDDYVTTEWRRDSDDYRTKVRRLAESLPKNPIGAVSVFIGSVNSENDALCLIREYAEYTNSDKVSAGIIGNCVLGTFGKTYGEVDPQLFTRHLLICPTNLARHQAKQAVSKLIADIKDISINHGKLNRLSQLCRPYFLQVDSGEEEIQEKIDGILNRMRETKVVEIETLKSWLSYVLERFSSLSVLSGSVKRDQVMAQSCAEENTNLVSQWSEINLKGYPTNTFVETVEYTNILRPFENFIGRTDALRDQLEIVSDMIRTYLGILQQEQSSEILKQQVKMLHSIEGHERLLKLLTWAVVIFTIALVALEVGRVLHIIP
jgi:hypothetical protein